MIPFFVVFFAWFFQSVTGFGAGIFIVGVLSLFYDPKMVIVSSAVFNLLGTLGLLYQNRKGKLNLYLLFSLLLGSLPGIFIGAYLLDIMDKRTLNFVIGFFIVFLGLYDLGVSRGWIKIGLSRHMGVPVGFLGGLFAGLVGMGGPPPLVFLSQHITDPHSIRLMLNTYFTFNILFRLFFYQSLEVSLVDWNFIVFGSLGLLLGLFAGGMLAKRLHVNQYRRGTPYAVIFLGLLIVVFAEVGL
ncbi:MAG: sulfite exporter TauE/SafE family protein [Aquificaceae bacterium]|nr:sulfite exporter TauE/SafE family protein [Aquificaceae bacterium]MCS7277502.1 sulfite exporter TauE/SafE family protein [Aquificaceae bacterium]MDW8066691.1 sulfite exporter TauE/SafE family protein [Aquificaceae bacterium]MDW8423581.1 sulfite exporter TauE/SafE family protein [Aquificaceae bacterium]